MKIDDLFKDSFSNSEMPVDSSLWDKLEDRINNTSSANNDATSTNNHTTSTNNHTTSTNNHTLSHSANIFTKLKNLSILSKAVISAVVGAGVITGGVLLYNNVEKSPNTLSSTTTLSSVPNQPSTTSTSAVDTATLSSTSLPTSKNNQPTLVPNIDFAIEDEAIEGVMDSKKEYKFEDLSTLLTDSIANTPYKTTIIEPTNTKTENKRENSQYQIKIKIPNVMTPNNDGVNDCFVISGIENYRDNKLIIFTRNGKTVYQKDNYNNEFCGQNVDEGVYFYRLRVRNEGYYKDFTGMIQIIK